MKKKKILFVDDEKAVLEGLRRMLRCQNDVWALTFVESPQEALKQLRQHDFDAIVSDLMMPGMDGLALLAAIREMDRAKDVPVVILTGSDEQGLKRRALDLGATDLLNKPVEREDLLARLYSVLRLKACQDELREHNERLEQKVRERTADLADSRLEIICRLGKVAEFRDKETGNHVVRVACYCRVLAETMGMDREYVERLFLASPLHDIGKIGIPDSILLKPSRLTPEEGEVMKRHCEIGAKILKQESPINRLFRTWKKDDAHHDAPNGGNPILDMASAIAISHHEKWDGSGYPRGLSGEAIPLESRIVAVADVYDALCSHRPYKCAYSEQEAAEAIRDGVGVHFDPTVCEAFEKSLSDIQRIGRELADPMLTPVMEHSGS